MIIPENKIIFIHIPKNMGSFIEILLLYNLSKISPEYTTFHNIIKNNNEDIIRGAQVDLRYKALSSLYKYNNLKSYNDYTPPFHLPLSYYFDNLYDEDIFNYKIFAIVRNPYDRIKSLYKFYIQIENKYLSFDTFMKEELFKNNPHFLALSKRQIDFIDVDLRWAKEQGIELDLKILKYEDKSKIQNYFQNDLNYEFIDIKVNESLIQKDFPEYENIILKEEHIKQINQYYEADFNAFKYNML